MGCGSLYVIGIAVTRDLTAAIGLVIVVLLWTKYFWSIAKDAKKNGSLPLDIQWSLSSQLLFTCAVFVAVASYELSSYARYISDSFYMWMSLNHVEDWVSLISFVLLVASAFLSAYNNGPGKRILKNGLRILFVCSLFEFVGLALDISEMRQGHCGLFGLLLR
jgi:hypothetical protein